MSVLENNIPSHRTVSLGFVWLLMMISGFVMFEPAPFELLGLCLIIVYFASGMSIPKGIGLAIIFWVIFLIFNILAGILSPDPSLAFKPIGIRFFLALIWVFLASLIAENPKRFLPILWNGYAVGAIIIILIGALAYLGKIPNAEEFLMAGRVKSTFKDPNVYGPYLVPLFMLYLSRLESGENSHFIVNVIMLAIVAIGLLLGFSRGSWLNLGLAMMIYMAIRLVTLKQQRELTRLIFMGALALVVGSILIGWLISTSAINDMFQERAHVVQGYDVTERFVTQMKAVHAILENPMGIGLGQAELQFSIVPHNVYLFIFSECGWGAGIAYLAFVFLTIWKGVIFCLRRTEIQLVSLVILSCIVSTQLQSFFIDSTHWRHLYILYGMMWGVILNHEHTQLINQS